MNKIDQVYLKVVKVIAWLVVIGLSFATLINFLFVFDGYRMLLYIGGILLAGWCLDVVDNQ